MPSSRYNKKSKYGDVVISDGYILTIGGEFQCSLGSKKSVFARSEIDEAIHKIRKKNKHVLLIGLGCGWTLEKLLSFGNVTVDVVERNSHVVEACKKVYKTPIDDDRVNIIIKDKDKYLKEMDVKYDLILDDLVATEIIK